MSIKSQIQYACAILLIVSSIVLAFYQVFSIDNVAHGTLLYIAQAFLLAGSIFGLEYYVQKFRLYTNGNYKEDTKGYQEQQPTKHPRGECLAGRGEKSD